MSITSSYKTAADNMGKPELPHGVSGKPQRVDGAMRNTPPKAFCYESYTVNTGYLQGNDKGGGK